MSTSLTTNGLWSGNSASSALTTNGLWSPWLVELLGIAFGVPVGSLGPQELFGALDRIAPTGIAVSGPESGSLASEPESGVVGTAGPQGAVGALSGTTPKGTI